MKRKQQETFRDWPAGGTVIGGRYRVLRRIGIGGMGTVYEAEDLRLPGKRWAVKMSNAGSDQGVRIIEEARLLMKLHHPRLPAIADYYPPDHLFPGVSVVVMELIEGNTLLEYAAGKDGKLEFREMIRIAVQLCQALVYLHGLNPPVIHRDLKPANVMVMPNGEIKLIDLGIARRYKQGQASDTVRLGTPGFAAPEQSGGRQSGPSADQYGLGALLYYLVSGGEYYRSDTAIRPERLTGMPASFAFVLERLLASDPSSRFESMSEALHAISRFRMEGDHFYLTEQTEFMGLSNSDNSAVKVTVSSFGQGAGATFLAITIAKLLAGKGVRCTAIEHSVVDPEWLALLDAGSKAGIERRRKLSFSPELTHCIWREQSVTWCALNPSTDFGAIEKGALERSLQHLSPDILLYDVSSHWQDPLCGSLMLDADLCLFVADPCPSKWRPDVLKLYYELAIRRGEMGGGRKTCWIANKDVPFRQRGEWLSLVPGKRIASIPQLPAADWTDWLWRGRWATDSAAWRHLLDERLQPLWIYLFDQ